LSKVGTIVVKGFSRKGRRWYKLGTFDAHPGQNAIKMKASRLCKYAQVKCDFILGGKSLFRSVTVALQEIP